MHQIQTPPSYAETQETNSTGQETGLPLPRFVSLNPRGASAVNVRTGPGVQYPIKWIFKRGQLPVKIVAEYDLWRRIQDMEGEQGWVHKSLLSGRRMAIVMDRMRVVYRKPDEQAVPAFVAEPGVIGRLETCDKLWCKLRVGNTSGWIKHSHIWGTFESEIFED